MKIAPVLFAAVPVLALPAIVGADIVTIKTHDPHPSITVELQMPEMDAARGRDLFVSKGCVVCHSVNGVGGEDASSLDAIDMEPVMNPFELAAKMWRMAPYMIEAQEDELGEQIQFTGDELADIVAFLHDDDEQHKMTLESLPEEMREMMEDAH